MLRFLKCVKSIVFLYFLFKSLNDVLIKSLEITIHFLVVNDPHCIFVTFTFLFLKDGANFIIIFGFMCDLIHPNLRVFYNYHSIRSLSNFKFLNIKKFRSNCLKNLTILIDTQKII